MGLKQNDIWLENEYEQAVEAESKEPPEFVFIDGVGITTK
ncbi:MAG: hypothetical protein NVSMB66_6480 [Candidatus Doudnabacteria bacterium]